MWHDGRVNRVCDEDEVCDEELEEERLDKFAGICWEIMKGLDADEARCPFGGDNFAKLSIDFCMVTDDLFKLTEGMVD